MLAILPTQNVFHKFFKSLNKEVTNADYVAKPTNRFVSAIIAANGISISS